MNIQTTTGGNRIGLFDSGVGGLSILRSLSQRTRGLKFVYLGDTDRCPYGNRSAHEISTYVEEIISWMNTSAVDQIVMACNTSAAIAAPLARRLSTVPVYDLITSSARFVAGRFKKIAVIATNTTCKSHAFLKAINEIDSSSQVFELACPDLVPLVERGVLSGPEVDATIAKYVAQLKEFDLDCLIFGCTHFPFLEKAFRKALGEKVSYVDPAVHLALDMLGNTQAAVISTDKESLIRNTYFCTGDPEKFRIAAETCLELEPGSLKNSVCHFSSSEFSRTQPDESMEAAHVNTVILKSPFFNRSI